MTATQRPPIDPARMPRQIPYIIASEGCERFSYYGMRNILYQFLPASMLMLHLPEEARGPAAKEVFHTFAMGVYFFPLLGGWLADRWFGKFNTILWFSLVYCLGHAFLALFEDSATGFYTGLFLIALGAGGIKPLVASFVGDQFDDRNKHLAKLVFDAFYWIINFGSFFASLFMPVILASYGPTVAFGVPGVLMLIATVVLWLGRRRYVMVEVQPPNPHSFMRVVRSALFGERAGRGLGTYLAIAGAVLGAAAFTALVWVPVTPATLSILICLALVLLIAFGGLGTALQLDRARLHHPAEAVAGVRGVLGVLVVFALVTPFHSLFDQKATTWVEQGKGMEIPYWSFDLGPLGEWETAFLPAQMQSFNPALVMLLIPFNNLILYPWLRRRGLAVTSLRRMTWGIGVSGLAWVAAGALQLVLDGGDRISILWQVLPYALLTFGEVLVSATGLELAYSQAPLAMKGVIMSFWNLTTTVGNLWVLLVDAGVRNARVTSAIEDAGASVMAFQMFFFAGFAFLAALAFRRYVRRYQLLDNYRAARDPGAGAGADALPRAEVRRDDAR
jgi:POT family proton-dependent oligopeptide transporter